jgi:arylsulfatase A-like enzyme/Flp pilus assembly protein TadD
VAPRPSALPTSLVLALVCLVAPACTSREPAAAGRPTAPNAPVVLISIDTLRADRLPAYGYKGVETPAIDRLRKDAILFERAYTHAPLTLPAHASLLSGLLPPDHGVRNNIGYALDARHETLAETLRARGYATGGFVSAFVLRRATGIARGFETYDDVATARGAKAAGEVQRPGSETVARALAWLRATGERPFFLFVHLYDPHTPWTPPEPQRARWGASYEGEIAAADAAVGTLLEGLRALGRYDSSVVVLTSDHGEGLGDHGEQEHGILLYREVLQVPLLVKLAGSERAGATLKAASGLRDLMPTIAALVGAQAPAAARGRDLLAAAKEAEAAEPGIYSETYYPRIHLGWSELRSLTDARYQLIDGPRPELYDLQNDFAQTRDVLAEKPQVAQAMRAALAAAGTDYRPPAPANAAERERLRSLGYLGASGGGADSEPGRALPNPRDRIQGYVAARAAFALVEQGRDEEAVRAFDRVLKQEPGFVDVLTERAAALGRLGRYRESAAAYRVAIERAPELAGPLSLTLGRVHLEMGDLEAARAAAMAALASDADAAHELLASTALAAGALDEAEREAGLVASDPGALARATVVRAEVLSRRGQPEQALALVDSVRADGLGPVPWLEFVRGDVLARLGRHADAERALRRELAEFPRHARAWASLAIVRSLSGAPLAESRALLVEMSRASPGRGSDELAAKALAFIGDDAGAAYWRRRAGR